MFIETEITPNPDTLKFLPGRVVLQQGTADFPDAESVHGKSPLAESLFRIEAVERVFFGNDFVSVTKAETSEWSQLKPAILGTLMEHFTAGIPVLNDMGEEQGLETPHHEAEDGEIVAKISELLESHVRPAVARDGGDITFHSFDKGIVYLSMRGACAGCPSSTATLKMGIENLLRHYVPQVVEVRPYNP